MKILLLLLLLAQDQVAWKDLKKSRRALVDRQLRELPKEIQALEGKWVLVSGFLFVSHGTEGRVREVVLAEQQLVPPTPYDSVDIKFKPGATLKDKYAKYATITGTFRVERQEAKGYLVSLFQLTDAYEGVLPTRIL